MYQICSEPLWTVAVVASVVCALTAQSVSIYGGYVSQSTSRIDRARLVWTHLFSEA